MRENRDAIVIVVGIVVVFALLMFLVTSQIPPISYTI
jgi:hypothetical protein